MGNCFSQTSTAPDEHTLVSRPHPNPAADVPVTDDTRPQLGLVALDGDRDATTARGKEPEPDARKGQAAGPLRESEAAPPLQLLLCRFQAGKLLKSVMFPASTDFLAISHVWGKAEWMKVDGIEHEIRVSREKAKFIKEQLPSIVGDQWFWMDVLCINQRDDEARVAITQHIPSVFRFAQRTIAVRDSSGFKDCCTKAIGDPYLFFSKSRDWRSKNEDDSDVDFGEGPDGRRRLIEHITEEHAGHVMNEGILTRLWPLQEIILSDKIQFVRCKPVEGDEQPRIATEYDARKMPVLGQSLAALAMTWSTHGEDHNDPMRHRIGFTKNELVIAFLELGTASRRYENREVLLPNERDIMLHLNSTRETGRARDFILAIMPQYGFYKAPKNAKQFTFTELFLDCCRQLREVDSGLSPLFLESDHLLDGRVGPLKVDLPEPKCLGDLAKLLNGPVMRCPPGSKVELAKADGVPMAKVMENAARILPNFAEVTDHHLQLAHNVLVIHTVVRSIFNSTVLWPISHHEINRELAALPPDADEKRRAIEALHIIISTIDLDENSYENAVRMTEYPALHDLLRNMPWRIPVTLAAMISCGLGISRLDWVLENMTAMQFVIDEVSYLALAPNSVALSADTAYYFKEGGEFFGGRDGSLPRQALLAGNPATDGYFTLCLFPPDTKFKGSREY
jgi:hypothetical protein